MKKIIFLDLDGVLNIVCGENATYKNSLKHFEDKLIDNLNNLLDSDKEIKIILSSSWRSEYDYIINLLVKQNFKHKDRIIGSTKILNIDRGLEILDWVKENNYSEKYICVDDNIKEIEPFINKENYLKIDPKIGLSENNCKHIFNYFNQ